MGFYSLHLVGLKYAIKVCPAAQVHAESRRASCWATAGTTSTGSPQREGGVYWLPLQSLAQISFLPGICQDLNTVQQGMKRH